MSDPRRLDSVDRRLLVQLSVDGRRPAADLAKELGLSRQAVTDRIRDLERRRLIRGYRADVDPAALGLGVRAQIRLTVDGSASQARENELMRKLSENPMIRAAYRVSGEDCFVVEVLCRQLDDVNALLHDLKATRAVSASRTAFVLEVVLDRGVLGQVDPALLEMPGATGGRS